MGLYWPHWKPIISRSEHLIIGPAEKLLISSAEDLVIGPSERLSIGPIKRPIKYLLIGPLNTH